MGMPKFFYPKKHGKNVAHMAVAHASGLPFIMQTLLLQTKRFETLPLQMPTDIWPKGAQPKPRHFSALIALPPKSRHLSALHGRPYASGRKKKNAPKWIQK
jgi:hypothetical protein